MSFSASKKIYLVVTWFFSLTCISFAQDPEKDLYKNMIKESIKLNFIPELMKIKPDSLSKPTTYRKYNPLKDYIPPLTYDLKYNELLIGSLAFKDSLDKTLPVIANYQTTPYTYSSESDEKTNDEVFSDVVLVPLTAIGTLNFVALLDYLVRTGIIPYDDPVVSRKSKKQKALEIITKEVYPTED